MRAAAPAERRVALLAAALVVGLLAFLSMVSPSAGQASSASTLVSAASCRGADDAHAALPVQRRAIACLVNVARKQLGRAALATPDKLRRASQLKGHDVASCGELSHTPCGADPTAAVRESGYRYAWFGENLWFGTWGQFTPREVVQSWLGSPSHRANILRPSFRHLGVARVRANGVFGEASTAVWVATFASPR